MNFLTKDPKLKKKLFWGGGMWGGGGARASVNEFF